jgi:riboflavin synthase
MFTGIIRELGHVSDLDRSGDGLIVTLSRPVSFSALIAGDSVAVNGVCLTVLTCDEGSWQIRLMHETLAKTNLGELSRGVKVNLERPVAAGERFDGHFVLGHVDSVAEILDITPAGDDRVFRFRPPANLLSYFIAKGSVALNGVGLTIVDVLPDSFTVSIMPYTLEHTTFGATQERDHVNVEVDMIAKHIARLVTTVK